MDETIKIPEANKLRRSEWLALSAHSATRGEPARAGLPPQDFQFGPKLCSFRFLTPTGSNQCQTRIVFHVVPT